MLTCNCLLAILHILLLSLMAEGKEHELKASESKFNKQFLAALESDTVSRKLSDIIQHAIAEKFNVKFDELINTVGLLRREVEAKDAVIANLSKACHDLETANLSLRKQLSSQDNQLRRDNVIITGLELAAADATAADGNSSTRLIQQVVRLCNEHLDCNVRPEDISFAYAIPLKRNAPPRPNAKRQVVVNFTRRAVRDNVYAARTRLKNYNSNTAAKIFINEDLASETQKLFSDLRKLVRDKALLGAWTNYNKVYVRKLDNSVRYVSCLADIN